MDQNVAVSTPQIPIRPEGVWCLDPRYGPRTPTQAAMLAVDLKFALGLTGIEARSVAGASLHYFKIARSLSPKERAMVRAGEYTLAGIVQARRKWAREIAKIA